MTRPKAYIAGPISNGGTADIPTTIDNVWNGIKAADKVWTLGFIPFCPHLSSFWNDVCPREYEEWIVYDFEWLALCDVVIRIPGESKGADREVAKAVELGIPVLSNVNELGEFMTRWKNGDTVEDRRPEWLILEQKAKHERIRTGEVSPSLVENQTGAVLQD